MSFLTKSALEAIFPFTVKNLTPFIYFVPNRCYAARKGYREQRAKKKVKTEVKKPKFELKKQEEQKRSGTKKFNDSWKSIPTDDVYPGKYYRWKVYSFKEAVLGHRETHHPQMYNRPNAYLYATVELDMTTDKKTKFLDSFSRISSSPNRFEHGEERTIVAFTKTLDTVGELVKSGATMAGGPELIKKIQNGDVNLQDYQYVLAHPNIMPELSALRGLMKKRYPTVKLGSLDVNLVELVLKFYHGINYTATRDEYEKDFGVIEAKIGTLNMDPERLEENFNEFINDVQSCKPRRTGDFIRRTLLWSPPSCEKLKIDHKLYIKSVEDEKKLEKVAEDESLETDEVTENERAVAV